MTMAFVRLASRAKPVQKIRGNCCRESFAGEILNIDAGIVKQRYPMTRNDTTKLATQEILP